MGEGWRSLSHRSLNPTPYFMAEDFTQASETGTLTCPTDVTPPRCIRNRGATGWK